MCCKTRPMGKASKERRTTEIRRSSYPGACASCTCTAWLERDAGGRFTTASARAPDFSRTYWHVGESGSWQPGTGDRFHVQVAGKCLKGTAVTALGISMVHACCRHGTRLGLAESGRKLESMHALAQSRLLTRSKVLGRVCRVQLLCDRKARAPEENGKTLLKRQEVYACETRRPLSP